MGVSEKWIAFRRSGPFCTARYEELKKAGKLEQYLAKRRRKNAAKDHRYVPGARREAA